MENLSDITKELFLNTPDNVTGVWIGFKQKGGIVSDEISVIFNVKEKLPLNLIPENERLPNEMVISGTTFKTDVISQKFTIIQEECPSDFYTWQTIPPPNQNKIRPLQGGLQITNYTTSSDSFGTMGFIAEDTETNSLVGVTNNHVIIEDAFINSERNFSSPITNTLNNLIIQPSTGSTDGIGVVKRYYPIYKTTGTNYIDAALLTLNSVDINNTTSYRQYNVTGWTQPLEFATTSEINNLLTTYPNLFSSGAKTGSKGEGEMKLLPYAINVTQAVGGYNRQETTLDVDFSDCIVFVASGASTPSGFICTYPIAPGDSGSALVANIGGTRKIIGLCFASSEAFGVANRIDRVASLLNIRPWTGQTTNFSDTGNTQTVSYFGSRTDITKSISGNTYWQAGGIL
jgi:hypothetical protein